MKEILQKIILVLFACIILVVSATVSYSLLNKKISLPSLPALSIDIPKIPWFDKNEEVLTKEKEDETKDAYQSLSDDRKKRYEVYGKLHPELDEETVKLQVNIGLDRPFYENTKEITDTASFPILVNKYNHLPENYIPNNLVLLDETHQVTAETKVAFDLLNQAAQSKGYTIGIEAAYVGFEEQKTIYAETVKQFSAEAADKRKARAGYSEHQTGCALDVYAPKENGYFEYSDTFLWLKDNSWQYGFILRYPANKTAITGYQYNPGHITYVGEDVARRMHEEGIATLEEYFAMNMKE